MHHTEPSAAGARLARGHRSSGRLVRALAAALVLPLTLGLAACGGAAEPEAPPAPVRTNPVDPNKQYEISFLWWGGEARAKLTEDALALYTKKYPNVKFKTTWQANQGYFDKLATLVAGNDAPDIFQIDDNYLTEYAGRAALDLTPYQQSGNLDTSKFPESLWRYGVVDNKLVGLAFGENTPGMVFSKTKLQALGVEEPQTGWSWEKLISWGAEVTTKSGGTYYGTMDPSADYKALWMWLRQQGKDLYKDGQLGFTEQDLTRWFELWKGARDTKAAPPADIIFEANSGSVTTQLPVTGKGGTAFMWANQMPELAKNTTDTLGVVAYPGDPSAQWGRASMYFSVYKGSPNRDVAVDVIDFLANDPEAGKILGTERGLPSNLDVRKSVEATVTDPNMKTTIAFQTELGSKFGPAPSVPPKGHATVRSEIRKAAEEVQYGRAEPAAAASAFFKAATAALNK
jgi:multiple sugar transport system substrate-binding protein